MFKVNNKHYFLENLFKKCAIHLVTEIESILAANISQSEGEAMLLPAPFTLHIYNLA